MTSDTSKLQGGPARLLAGGVVVLEFAAAVSSFMSDTLLPVIEQDLAAQRLLPLLLSGGLIGMFTALPLSPRIIQQYSPARVLTVGLLVSVVGSGLAAAAPTVLVFAAGRFIAGFAGAVLAVYGVSAAIRYLEDSLRLKVIAAMSAMWILPAVVGPSIAIAIEHTTSWRIAVLVPLPVMVIGRFLVMRAAPEQQAGDEQRRPIARTLLVPAGIAGFVALNASPWPAVSPVAILVALIGFLALMPAGTARLRRGAPAALAGLTLFAAGYFGASALVTLLLTHTFGATLVQAGVVLSAAQIGWGVAALLAPKLGARGLPPVWGLALAASGVLAIAILGLTGGPWGGALVAWTCSGVGIGLSYPALYLRATTETPF